MSRVYHQSLWLMLESLMLEKRDFTIITMGLDLQSALFHVDLNYMSDRAATQVHPENSRDIRPVSRRIRLYSMLTFPSTRRPFKHACKPRSRQQTHNG